MRFQTRCVHTGCRQGRAVSQRDHADLPDVDVLLRRPGAHQPYDYTRSGNPADGVGRKPGVAGRRDTVPGDIDRMSAITAIMHLFQAGDHIIAGHDTYGGTFRLFHNVYAARGFEFSFVDLGTSRTSPRARGRIRKPSGSRPPAIRCSACTTSQQLWTLLAKSARSQLPTTRFSLRTCSVRWNWRRYRHAFDDKVPQRALRRRRRCVITRQKEHSEQIATW